MTTSEHFPLPLRIEFLDNGNRARLLFPFEFVDGEDIIHVPASFETDFNSTPRIVWWWFPKTEFPHAGTVHDWLYRHPGGRTRDEVDRIHRRILLLSGCRPSKAAAAYYGLRVGSGRTWERYRLQNHERAQALRKLAERVEARKEDVDYEVD